MASTSVRKIKNAPYRVQGVILLVASFRPLATALTTPDAEISKDGGSFNDCSDEAHDIGTTGYFYVDLTATETACDHITFVQKCADAGTIYYIEKITFEPAIDSGVATAGGAATITLRAGNTLADNQPNGCTIEIVDGTGKGQARVVADFDSGTEVLTVDRDWVTNPDNTSVYIIHPRQNAGLTDMSGSVAGRADVRTAGGATGATASTIAAGLRALGLSGVSTIVNDASPTTGGFISGLSASTSNHWRYSAVTFLTGDLQGKTFQIASFNQSTGAITVYPAMPVAPADQDEIFAHGLFV